MRRARVDLIFEEYERQISDLEDKIKELQSQLEVANKSTPHSSSNIGPEDRLLSVEELDANGERAVHMLTVKLEMAVATAERLGKEAEKGKEANLKLRDENVALSIENGRLKQCLAARSPRKYEKYGEAAMQVKVNQFTKEIRQLKKALDKGDAYIEELENRLATYQAKYGDVCSATFPTIRSPKEDSFLAEKPIPGIAAELKSSTLSTSSGHRHDGMLEKDVFDNRWICKEMNPVERDLQESRDQKYANKPGGSLESLPHSPKRMLLQDASINSAVPNQNPIYGEKVEHRSEVPSTSALLSTSTLIMLTEGETDPSRVLSDSHLQSKAQSPPPKDRLFTFRVNDDTDGGSVPNPCKLPRSLSFSSGGKSGSIGEKEQG